MTDLQISDLADTLARVLHPEYNAVPLADAILAVDKLLAQIEEARMWARHGYEIGQRSNTWSDHGVAPAWLTEGHAAASGVAADDFRWHVLSDCTDEAVCPIHGRDDSEPTGPEDGVDLPELTAEDRQQDALTHTHDTGTDHWGGRWAWRCDGHQHCTGNISLGHLTQEAAANSYLRHVDECHGEEPTEQQLHERRACPGWEYATTEGPRKAWDDVDRPPSDENGEPDHSWERNVDAGRDGWERFDYTEEAYWRRRVATPATQATIPPGSPDGSSGYAGESERLPDGTCPDWCPCHRLKGEQR